MLLFCSDVSVFDMDSGLFRVNPDHVKRLPIASETTCPKCKSKVVYRTKRRGIMERIILYPLGFRAFHCKYCRNRFCSRTKPAGSLEE